MSSFTAIYGSLLTNGKLVSPRGQRTLELENALVTFKPYERFASFPSRRLSLAYIRAELLWYLRGDPNDLSICDKAKLWQAMVTDGQLNSNYGKYVFRDGQLDYAVGCLVVDPASRRAVISVLGSQHLYAENNDVPCTVMLSFKIRDAKLACTVTMRSSDAIFGLGNDLPFFSLVQEMVFCYLRQDPRCLVNGLGPLTIFSSSLHVYERHFEMLEALAIEAVAPVHCPRLMDFQEVDDLRKGVKPGQKGLMPFSQWLLATEGT